MEYTRFGLCIGLESKQRWTKGLPYVPPNLDALRGREGSLVRDVSGYLTALTITYLIRYVNT